MQRKVNLFQGPKYDKYNQLRLQLQRQNAALLKQRSKIQTENEGYRPHASQQASTEKNQYSMKEEEEKYEDLQLPHFDASIFAKGKSDRSTFKSGRRKSIREQINQRGEALSDDIMEMIDQIQRKALEQIQSLRADKIDLMKKLNKEIKDNNSLKRDNAIEKKQAKKQQQQKKRNSSSQVQASQPYPASQPFPIEQQDSQEHSPTNRRSYRQQNYENENSNIQSRKKQAMSNFNPPNRRQTPMKINNQNVLPSQSLLYVNKPKTNRLNSQVANGQLPAAEVEQQIKQLRQHNAHLKNNLSEYQSTTNTSEHKNRLKSELNDLYEKAKYFEQLITQEKRARQNNEQMPNFSGSQFETLMLQGANLAEEGQRLMRVKSNPHFYAPEEIRKAPPSYINSNSGIVVGTTRTQRPIQAPLENSRKIGKARVENFGSGEYERLIENMRRAANS